MTQDWASSVRGLRSPKRSGAMVVSRVYWNILYRNDKGILFPRFLLTTSKHIPHQGNATFTLLSVHKQAAHHVEMGRGLLGVFCHCC